MFVSYFYCWGSIPDIGLVCVCGCISIGFSVVMAFVGRLWSIDHFMLVGAARGEYDNNKLINVSGVSPLHFILFWTCWTQFSFVRRIWVHACWCSDNARPFLAHLALRGVLSLALGRASFSFGFLFAFDFASCAPSPVVASRASARASLLYSCLMVTLQGERKGAKKRNVWITKLKWVYLFVSFLVFLLLDRPTRDPSLRTWRCDRCYCQWSGRASYSFSVLLMTGLHLLILAVVNQLPVLWYGLEWWWVGAFMFAFANSPVVDRPRDSVDRPTRDPSLCECVAINVLLVIGSRVVYSFVSFVSYRKVEFWMLSVSWKIFRCATRLGSLVVVEGRVAHWWLLTLGALLNGRRATLFRTHSVARDVVGWFRVARRYRCWKLMLIWPWVLFRMGMPPLLYVVQVLFDRTPRTRVVFFCHWTVECRTKFICSIWTQLHVCARQVTCIASGFTLLFLFNILCPSGLPLKLTYAW